jgi:hypothetical protein
MNFTLEVSMAFTGTESVSTWWQLSETILKNVAHGVTSQKTAFFIVTAVKTSNLT